MKVRITPIGAAGTVTGSMYLFEYKGHKFLIEAGMFQGHLEPLNYEDFPFDPKEIEFIILSHPHLDHIGLLPKLVREGFSGEVIATPATRDIASIMLLDAAHLQEEDWKIEHRKALRRGEEIPEILYDVQDATMAMHRFGRTVSYEGKFEPFDGVSFWFRDAGHVLGSAFLEIDFDGTKVVFSGDLGHKGKPIIRDPERIATRDVDLLIIESTYGKRDHRSVEESVQELKEAIQRTIERGGNVLIPSFSLERAQDILFYLREFYEQGELPPNARVFLDSPLAISATQIFRAHPECFDEETLELVRSGIDPFLFPGVRFTRSVDESKRINDIRSGAIIIAGSGMCTGGRIKHHLKHNLWRPECSVIFVGYQAHGTLGRRIVDGAKEVTIYGERIAVQAEIYTINGFSGHAGRSGLLEWADGVQGKHRALVVHGEPEESQSLADGLRSLGFEDVQVAERLKPIEV